MRLVAENFHSTLQVSSDCLDHISEHEKPIAASILARRTSAFLQTALSDLLRSSSFYYAQLFLRSSSDRVLTFNGQLKE